MKSDCRIAESDLWAVWENLVNYLSVHYPLGFASRLSLQRFRNCAVNALCAGGGNLVVSLVLKEGHALPSETESTPNIATINPNYPTLSLFFQYDGFATYPTLCFNSNLAASANFIL